MPRDANKRLTLSMLLQCYLKKKAIHHHKTAEMKQYLAPADPFACCLSNQKKEKLPPISIVEKIFQDAPALVNSGNCIVPGPGSQPNTSKATQRREGVANKPYRTTTAYGNAESLKDATLPEIQMDDHHYQEAVVARVPLPDPVPGSYIVTLLSFCHYKTSKCYGCSGAFKEGSAIPPPST